MSKAPTRAVEIPPRETVVAALIGALELALAEPSDSSSDDALVGALAPYDLCRSKDYPDLRRCANFLDAFQDAVSHGFKEVDGVEIGLARAILSESLELLRRDGSIAEGIPQYEDGLGCGRILRWIVGIVVALMALALWASTAKA